MSHDVTNHGHVTVEHITERIGEEGDVGTLVQANQFPFFLY